MTRLKRLDHVVIAVRELDEAARAWERNLGLKADPAAQAGGSGVKLASLPAGNAFVQLVQPSTGDHPFAAFMDERGEGMFALSVEVDDLEAAVAELRGRGVQVSDPEPGMLEGTRIARISRDSAHGAEIQLLQRR
jgi:methylmalonyl-CoA/ethylmalonyl-CoA epimerase